VQIDLWTHRLLVACYYNTVLLILWVVIAWVVVVRAGGVSTDVGGIGVDKMVEVVVLVLLV